MNRNTRLQAAAGYKVCRHCHQLKPLTEFERLKKDGAWRGVCNKGKSELYTVPAQRRYQLRQAELFLHTNWEKY